MEKINTDYKHELERAKVFANPREETSLSMSRTVALACAKCSYIHYKTTLYNTDPR